MARLLSPGLIPIGMCTDEEGSQCLQKNTRRATVLVSRCHFPAQLAPNDKRGMDCKYWLFSFIDASCFEYHKCCVFASYGTLSQVCLPRDTCHLFIDKQRAGVGIFLFP